MTVHGLRLVWKHAGEDVVLGTCFTTTRPVAGELISYSSDEEPGQTGVWRVVLVYHEPFMERSLTWANWRTRGEEPQDMTTYWVEPAEGPWEP
jgi:hypothetical protein